MGSDDERRIMDRARDLQNNLVPVSTYRGPAKIIDVARSGITFLDKDGSFVISLEQFGREQGLL